jgi:hypothetical protein
MFRVRADGANSRFLTKAKRIQISGARAAPYQKHFAMRFTIFHGVRHFAMRLEIRRVI